MYRTVSIFTLAFLVSCSSVTDTPSHTFQSYEENGVSIAKTTSGPKHQEELFRYKEQLKLNQDEAQPASLLAQPMWFMMDEDHAVYLTDNRTDRIVCFSPDGNYSHDIGRSGEGPGEFQNAHLISVGDGIVAVFDFRLNRTSFFQTDGTFLESISIPQSRFSIQELHRGPSGEMILLGQENEMGRNTFRYSTGIVHLLSTEEDTIATLSTERVKISYDYVADEYSTGGMSWFYFSGWPMAKYHVDYGIYLTTGHDPSIRIYSLNGLLQRVIMLDMPPISVTDAERRAVKSYYRQRIQNADNERYRESARKQLEYLEFCDPKSYWFGIRVEENGFIWAAWPENFWIYALGDLHVPTFRIFNPAGVYIGDTQHPVRSGTVSRGHLIAELENEDSGEIEIVVYRIIPKAEGLKYP